MKIDTHEVAAVSRRQFLAGCAGMGGMFLASARLAAAGGRRLDRVGLQLYTVRDRMAEDVAATLEAVAAIGYDEVEFAGYFGHTPDEIRKLLRDTGLSAPAAHVPLDAIRGEPARLVDAALAVGHDYLVLPWLAEDERRTLDQYRRLAELCNGFGERCRAAGVTFAYHNHEFEFVAIEGVLPFDLLLEETEPSLVKVELDLYWTVKGGAEPLAYFEAWPGRFPLCHVKDMAENGAMTEVGSGTIDFPEIFAASGLAGLEHYFVERDDAADSLASAAQSFEALSSLEY